jgi:hypothetical protein
MDKQGLHEFLVGSLGLIPELTDNTISRTYFYREIEWHPERSSRVFRVLFDPSGEPARIQFLIHAPFDQQQLSRLASNEVASIEAKARSRGGMDLG